MTITVKEFPAPFRTIPDSVRLVLKMSFLVTDAGFQQLEQWANDAQNRQFDDWSAAVEAALAATGEDVRDFYELDRGQELLDLVLHAGHAVQGLVPLTGAAGMDLTQKQADSDQHFAAVLRLGHALSALNRYEVTAENLGDYTKQIDLPALYHWEPALVELLVQHPFLAARRPRILQPGQVDSSRLTSSLLVAAKTDNQSSAVGHLDATAGNQRVQGALVANSGNNVIAFHQRVAPVGRDDTGARMTPISPKAQHDYQAFSVTTARDRAPHSRNFDGEKRILDAVSTLLFDACHAARVGLHEVTGTLRFATTLRMCPSCYLVACQFLVNFPGIDVEVSRIPG
jgi:hypothetical protein